MLNPVLTFRPSHPCLTCNLHHVIHHFWPWIVACEYILFLVFILTVNFSTSGCYFHSNLLFFLIEKHFLIYIYTVLSKTGKFIFCQEKGQWIIVQNNTANPCKIHAPSALLHIYIPVLLEITSLVEQSHSAIRWSCFLLVWLQLKHLFVFGRSCFFLWNISCR